MADFIERKKKELAAKEARLIRKGLLRPKTLKSIGTYRGRLVYVETTPEGDRIPFYNAFKKIVHENGLKIFYPRGKLVRIYIYPDQIK